MNNLLLQKRLKGIGVILTSMALLGTMASWIPIANADKLGDASEITGVEGVEGQGSEAIKDAVINIVVELLQFVALAATIVIIIGGIYLIVGAGSDQSREKAKNIILYTLVGIIVILLAAGIVSLVIQAGGG